MRKKINRIIASVCQKAIVNANFINGDELQRYKRLSLQQKKQETFRNLEVLKED